MPIKNLKLLHFQSSLKPSLSEAIHQLQNLHICIFYYLSQDDLICILKLTTVVSSVTRTTRQHLLNVVFPFQQAVGSEDYDTVQKSRGAT